MHLRVGCVVSRGGCIASGGQSRALLMIGMVCGDVLLRAMWRITALAGKRLRRWKGGQMSALCSEREAVTCDAAYGSASCVSASAMADYQFCR
jgi:hypothetical protein